MALDSTIGGSTTNSYVSEAWAGAYFSDRLHNTVWEESEDQASALVTASRMLDHYCTWVGTKATSAQSMEFPRIAVTGGSVTFTSSEIPVRVMEATVELAISCIPSDRTGDNDLGGLLQVNAGSLMIKTDNKTHYQNTAFPDTIPDKVWKILRGYVIRGAVGRRLVRG